MRRLGFILITLLLLPRAGDAERPRGSLSRIRLAIIHPIGLSPDLNQAVLEAITTSAGSNPSLTLMDQDLVNSAVGGSGHDGSFNLTLRDARNLGEVIGCDFYLLVRSEMSRVSRSSSLTESEGWAAIFLVSTRSGQLIRFDWVLESADSDQEARLRLAKSLIERMDSLLRMIVNAEPVQPRLPYHGRVALDLTREEPPPTYEAPTFVKREQPLYTPEAERAEVSGTVEIEAVFGQDGNLREPEIIRWAGYGLDQSALQAAERIRFTPAKLNGARISVKARLRYNFTRRQPR